MSRQDPEHPHRELVALANADYESRKAEGISCNTRTLEREWRLKAGQLQNYRANRKRRSDPDVTLIKGYCRRKRDIRLA